MPEDAAADAAVAEKEASRKVMEQARASEEAWRAERALDAARSTRLHAPASEQKLMRPQGRRAGEEEEDGAGAQCDGRFRAAVAGNGRAPGVSRARLDARLADVLKRIFATLDGGGEGGGG